MSCCSYTWSQALEARCPGACTHRQGWGCSGSGWQHGAWEPQQSGCQTKSGPAKELLVLWQPCRLISSTHCSVEAPDNSFGLVIRGANGSKSCGSLPCHLSVSLSAWPAHWPAPLSPAHALGSIWRRCNCFETIVPSLDPSPKWHLQGNERAELTASPWSQRLLLITDEESLQQPSP